MKTKSMPFGNVEGPINPISLALLAGATFIARGFSAEQKHLTELIKQGIQHKGFSFIDVFSPCVTYNHDNTFQWFRPRVKKLEDNPEYDSTNWMAAMEKSLVFLATKFPSANSSSAPTCPPCTNQNRYWPPSRWSSRARGFLPTLARAFVEELM